MLTDNDKKWLKDNYPGLTPNTNGASGIIEFTATYNSESGSFLILRGGVTDDVGGVRLSGKFQVRIEERTDKTWSNLPAVYIDSVEPIANRHFSQKDSSACLCSPFDESKFINPELKFPIFFEELIIPFLYGQLFYTLNSRWPWSEYSHGGLGLLESYLDFNDQLSAADFLAKLKNDTGWVYYEKLIQATRPSKQKCPCASGDKFRDCHPKALKGFIQLKKDLNE